MNPQIGWKLIAELWADPQKFDEAGRAYELLQEYFDGLPITTLRPLLRSDDVFVQRSGAFIASELGSSASELVDDVIPLLNSADPHVPYYAMEVLTVCCEGTRAAKFAHVVKMLESPSSVLRDLAMDLLSRADKSQLDAARRYFENTDSHHPGHALGLNGLVEGDSGNTEAARSMLDDADPLIRLYGEIATRRFSASD